MQPRMQKTYLQTTVMHVCILLEYLEFICLIVVHAVSRSEYEYIYIASTGRMINKNELERIGQSDRGLI